jgi:hypothetical protein
MATFHPFPRLPLELRVQIWENTVMRERVLRVQKLKIKLEPNKYFSSPTPAPAVTRACQESRKYCSYQKAFIIDQTPRYIWTCFETDIVQMDSTLMGQLAKGDSVEKNEIRHFRLELMSDGWDLSESFYHFHSHLIRNFPRLERCDILVHDGLCNWCRFIEDGYWGSCPKSNVRFIDAKTGEWIDVESDGPYEDYSGNYIGIEIDEEPVWSRIVDDWDEENEDHVKERSEAMMKIREGLPRIDLNY